MPRYDRQIHLLAPGLLGPMPGVVELDTVNRPERIERLLDRSSSKPFAEASYEATLFKLFGIEKSDSDYPLAAISRLGDGQDADDRCWLQINPVFLRPDQDRLLVFDSVDLDFSIQESKALAQLFSEHFSDESWQLEVVTPHRWYLALNEAIGVSTVSMEKVFGRSISRFLPAGSDSLRWHGFLNEAQMLFHTSPVNAQREQAGKLPINGVWFSGAGVLPKELKPRVGHLFADSGLAWGAALHAGISFACLPTAVEEIPDGDTLFIYEEMFRPVWRADPYDWYEALSRFNHWIEPIVAMLDRKQISELMIYPCDGQVYRATKQSLRQFWKRKTPITERFMRN